MEPTPVLDDKVQDGNGINAGVVNGVVFMPESLGRFRGQN